MKFISDSRRSPLLVLQRYLFDYLLITTCQNESRADQAKRPSPPYSITNHVIALNRSTNRPAHFQASKNILDVSWLGDSSVSSLVFSNNRGGQLGRASSKNPLPVATLSSQTKGGFKHL